MKRILSGALFTKSIIRLTAIVLTAVMLLGNLPIYAASKKTAKVTDSGSLTKALKNSKVQKITLKTSKKVKLTIPDILGTQKKELIISAPKAEIINCAQFKSVTINEIGSYREEAVGNSITVNAKANKKPSIVLTKKTKLIVNGAASSRTNIVSKAKGSTVTAYAPVDISVSKNMTVKLEKGSEGSSIDKSKKSIKVTLKNNSGSDPVIKVAGKAVTNESEGSNNSGKIIENEKESIDSSGIYLSYNSGQNNYVIDGWTVKSYLFKEDGYFWRVEAETDGDYLSRTDENAARKSEKYVYIEKYDSSWKLKDTKKLFYDSSLIWGGFYHGEKYNFVILGDRNDAEDDNKMVVRVIKYDKKWNKLSSVDLKGAYTTCPFSAGSLRCTEKDGYLYVITAHTRYTTEDGLRHQSNMLFSVDEEKMTIPYAGYLFQPGYCSHSFNQYILVNEYGQLVTVDHGDGYPRGIQLSVLNNEDGILTDEYYGERYLVFPIEMGSIGDNSTGASVGGIEETVDGYMISFNYDELGGQEEDSYNVVRNSRVVSEMSRNIYLEFFSKYPIDNSTNMYGIRIDYDLNGTINNSTPIMVSIGAEKGGYIFWGEYDKTKDVLSKENQKVCYVKYDTEGNISEIQTFMGNLSDCKPIYEDGFIYWYVTGNSIESQYYYSRIIDGKDYKFYSDIEKTVPYLYSLDTNTGEVKIRMAGGTEKNVPVSLSTKTTTKFINGITNGFDFEGILYTKDILNKSGKIIRTEYYDRLSRLRSKDEYEYDKNGILKKKTYTLSDNDNFRIEYVYHDDGETLKSINRYSKSTGTQTYTSIIEHTTTIDEERDEYTEYYEDGKTIKSNSVTDTRDTHSDEGVITKKYEKKSYEFFSDGRIKSGEEVSTDYKYDDKGNLSETRSVETDYKEDGQISEIWYYGSDKNSGQRQRYIYEDGLKKQYVYYFGDGRSSTEFYDEAGKVIKSVYDGVTERSSETLYEYDAEGNMTRKEIKYSDGYTYIYEYYSDGKEKSSEVRGDDGSVRIDKYEYDDKGNTVREERREEIGGNLNGYILTNQYLEDGTHISVRTGLEGTAKTTTYYNKKGERVKVIEECPDGSSVNDRGYIQTTEYNMDGSYSFEWLWLDTNEKNVGYYDKNKVLVKIISYDGDGNVIS